jgi:starch synthase
LTVIAGSLKPPQSKNVRGDNALKIGFVIFTDLSRQRADAIHVKNLLREFEAAGIELGVFTSRLETVQPTLKQLNFLKKMSGRSLVLLKLLMIKKRYDLFYLRDWLFAYLMSFFGFPYVFEVNGLLCYEGLIRNYFKSGSKTHAVFAAIEKRVLKSAVKIVCVSRGMKDYCSGIGIDTQKILVAENAANPDTFNPDLPKAEIEKSDNKILIGWLGSFESHHGFDDLIAIVARLKRRKCNDVKFLIIGGGKAKVELEQNLIKENLQDYLIFCGKVSWNEVPKYLLNVDFCLCLDRRTKENLEYRSVIGVTQVKVYEYLALGKAVLAQDLGNAGEFFRDRKIGWVCGIEPLQVADRIIEIIKNPQQIKEYSKNALTVSKMKHTWKITAGKIIDFLGEPP